VSDDLGGARSGGRGEAGRPAVGRARAVVPTACVAVVALSASSRVCSPEPLRLDPDGYRKPYG
jgi:hypothetical protein